MLHSVFCNSAITCLLFSSKKFKVLDQSCVIQNNPKDLDPSYKTDLDLWDYFGRKILSFIIVRKIWKQETFNKSKAAVLISFIFVASSLESNVTEIICLFRGKLLPIRIGSIFKGFCRIKNVKMLFVFVKTAQKHGMCSHVPEV